MTAADVINEIRDGDLAFEPGLVPDGVLVRFLGRYELELIRALLAIYPDPLLTAYEEFLLPFPDFDGGEAMPDHLFARPREVVWNETSRAQLHFVEPRTLASPPRWPAAAIQGGRIYLARTESAWVNGEKLIIDYVPVPVAPTTKESNLSIDETALEALVAGGAYFAARRLAGREPVPVSQYREERNAAREAWLIQKTNQRRAVVRQIRT